jgi:hypothetical protein
VYATYEDRLTAYDLGAGGRLVWSLRFAPREAWRPHVAVAARDVVILATPDGIVAVTR